jgi:hypothetical protein
MYFSVSGVVSATSNSVSVSYTGSACNGTPLTVYQSPHSGGFDTDLTVHADALLLTTYTGFFTPPGNTYTVYVADGAVDPAFIYHYTGTDCLGAPLTVYSSATPLAVGSTVWTDKCADTSVYEGYLVYPAAGTVYPVSGGVLGTATTCPSIYTGYSVTPCVGGTITIYQTIDTGFDVSYTVYADEVGTVFTGGFTISSVPYYCVSGVAVQTADIGCLFGFSDAVDCCSGDDVYYYTIYNSPLQDNNGRLYKYVGAPVIGIVPYTGAYRLTHNNVSRIAADGYQSFSNNYYCHSGGSTTTISFYSSAADDYVTLYCIPGVVAAASDYAGVQAVRWFTNTPYDSNNPACSTVYIAEGFYSYDPIYGPHYQMFNGYAHQI